MASVTIPYRDSWLLVGDKPAGVLSQPVREPGRRELAFDELVLLAVALGEGRRPYLRLVHRLDRVTSGLLLFARLPEAASRLAEAWRRGEVQRRYLAVVEGEPAFDREVIEAPIARQRGGGWRFEVGSCGRASRTDVEVLTRGVGWALVECSLRSGRTHQVRVHLAHVGLPVRGDRLYGGSDRASRPLLHAATLSLPHPCTGRPLELSSPLPAELSPYQASRDSAT